MLTKSNILLPNLGLDVSKPAEYIESRAFPQMRNMSLNRNVIHKRYGSIIVGATASEEIMYIKELLVDATRYIVRIGLTGVDLLNESAGTWGDITNVYTIDATNNKINFDIGGGELTAIVSSGVYPPGFNHVDAGSLCKAVYDALSDADATSDYTVLYAVNKFILVREVGGVGENWSILWKTGTNGSDGTDTHIGTTIGFNDSADDTGGSVYIADNATSNNLTGTTNDPFFTATPLLSGARILVFTNFIDNIRKYTGSGGTVDLGGSPPKAKYLIEYGAYLVLAHIEDGGTKYRMRVQWCDTGDIETWTGGNSGSQDLVEDGNDITGLNVFGNYVCVHKETSIYLGYLTSTSDIFLFDRRNTGVGTICNNTIQNIGNNSQLFLARDGIRLFNGVSAPLIESPVIDELRESINSEYLHKCWSIILPELNEYWVGVAIGSQTSPDTVYKYNYVTGACYKDYMPGISATGRYQRTSDLTWQDQAATWANVSGRWDDVTYLSQHQTVIYGGSTGITTRRDSSYSNDNGVAINAYVETKDFILADLGFKYEPGRFVRWTEMQVFAKGNGVSVEYSTDSGVTWTPITTLTLDSDYPSDDAPDYVYFDVVSTKIRFKFKNNTSAETFHLKDFVIGGIPREIRR